MFVLFSDLDGFFSGSVVGVGSGSGGATVSTVLFGPTFIILFIGSYVSEDKTVEDTCFPLSFNILYVMLLHPFIPFCVTFC